VFINKVYLNNSAYKDKIFLPLIKTIRPLKIFKKPAKIQTFTIPYNGNKNAETRSTPKAEPNRSTLYNPEAMRVTANSRTDEAVENAEPVIKPEKNERIAKAEQINTKCSEILLNIAIIKAKKIEKNKTTNCILYNVRYELSFLRTKK
jgi:hypothetical protein